MMPRRPEPEELMDDPGQALAYAEADFDEAHSAIVAAFDDYFPGAGLEGCVLDLGCGPGDIVFRMARAFPNWQITGLDAGENMLRCARQRLADEHGCGNVEFRHVYLPDVRPGQRYGLKLKALAPTCTRSSGLISGLRVSVRRRDSPVAKS